MNLARALRLLPPRSLRDTSPKSFGFGGGKVGVVGSGGKTTAIFQLARELPTPALVTATSHLGAWQISYADHHFVADSPNEIGELQNGVTLVTGALNGDRTKPVSAEVLGALRRLAGEHNLPLLIEADGSRGMPLKAPAVHEPPIPDFVDLVIVVAGMSGLGKPMTDEFVFRAEQFARISESANQRIVTEEALIRALCHPEGGLKNIPPGARRVVLLNQADTTELQASAQRISHRLLKSFDAVLIASLKDKIIHAAHEQTGGIVLAAGESKRFGTPKQLLDWRGETFIHAAARKALAAGLSPVAVVTGSNAEAVEKSIHDLDVKIIRNTEWQSGQASSIVAGIQSLPPKTGAAIFLLADQPQVSVEVLRALAESHSRELPAILAPLVLGERRANPVLFDRVTFPDLLHLQGDVGGRTIFDMHKVEYLPWHDDSLLLDVDTPEDYNRLRERAE